MDGTRPSEPNDTGGDGTPAEVALSTALAAVGGAVGGVIGGPLGGAVGGGASHTLVELARYRLALANEAASRAAEVAGDVDRLVEALRDDDRLAMTLLNALDDAARTSLAAKRRVLGRAIGQAAVDSAKIDTAQLREAALRDLDAPHLQTLARFRDAAAREEEGSSEEARKLSLEAPQAVIRGLDRHGLVQNTDAWDSTVVDGLTLEGIALLEELEQEGGLPN